MTDEELREEAHMLNADRCEPVNCRWSETPGLLMPHSPICDLTFDILVATAQKARKGALREAAAKARTYAARAMALFLADEYERDAAQPTQETAAPPTSHSLDAALRIARDEGFTLAWRMVEIMIHDRWANENDDIGAQRAIAALLEEAKFRRPSAPPAPPAEPPACGLCGGSRKLPVLDLDPPSVTGEVDCPACAAPPPAETPPPEVPAAPQTVPPGTHTHACLTEYLDSVDPNCPCQGAAPQTTGGERPLTFDLLTEINRRRCESWHAFGESLQDSSKYTVAHWALSIASEVGEICDAILGWQGLKERRKDKTKDDVGREIADVVIYCDLLASKLGFDLGKLVVDKFDAVTKRSGFPERFLISRYLALPPTTASGTAGKGTP